LSDGECDRFVEIADTLGFTDDAPVSLARDIRHNESLNWIVDEGMDGPIWDRCGSLFEGTSFDGARPLGLNARFRFYRYGEGDYFAPHTDGAWPGSRVIDDELVANAWPDRFSQYSLVLFLSSGFDGGATEFYLNPDDPSRPAYTGEQAVGVAVETALGAALCFPHGRHPQHCLHSSTPIERGRKYIVRSDILFEL